MASEITTLTIVYLTIIEAQINENIKAPRYWPFVRGIHRGPMNSPHKGPVVRKMFPFDDVRLTIKAWWEICIIGSLWGESPDERYRKRASNTESIIMSWCLM